jgi:signal transduction histidine kinase
MLSGWPIRRKLSLVLALLLVSVVILAFSGFRGVYAFRALARGISRRATELPIALSLAQYTSVLEATVQTPRQAASVDGGTSIADGFLVFEFRNHLESVAAKLQEYRSELENNRATNDQIGDTHSELEAARRMEQLLDHISQLTNSPTWSFNDSEQLELLFADVQAVNRLAVELPSFLQTRMNEFTNDVRLQYRTWIVMAWLTSASAFILLGLMMKLFYSWVFQPLNQLIEGSRRVAAGDFHFRIRLRSQDEMAELAGAMNDMTQRFQEIRDDLDQQVKQRTKEVVRGEQLASVGFLAAGVAHEINNPLASIALCAESLEERVREIIPIEATDDQGDTSEAYREQVEIIHDYLRMIQDEAFRCKGITERLLDFSRLGDVQKQITDLTELVQSVIEMVSHVGKYKEKHVELLPCEPIAVWVSPPEIKQVVLNLITNGLDSLDPGGRVTIRLEVDRESAIMVVSDNGCGMTDEVLEHLFEPFFTRRRDGQGTGLGMSISYRIVADHGGSISASSAGTGRGSTFTVRLPRLDTGKRRDYENRYQAA